MDEIIFEFIYVPCLLKIDYKIRLLMKIATAQIIDF